MKTVDSGIWPKGLQFRDKQTKSKRNSLSEIQMENTLHKR
jgi:hypothetical protein